MSQAVLDRLVGGESSSSSPAINIGSSTARVLIIYTGGTIGMRNIVPKGFCPSPGFLPSQMAGMALFNDSSTSAPGTLNVEQPTAHSVNIPYESHNGNNGSSSHGSTSASSVVINGTRCVKIKLPALVTPTSWYGKRTRYSILEYEKLLDSSNMTMSDWVKIATVKTVCGGWMGGCEAGGLTLWGVISQSLIYKDIEINYTLFDAFIILHGTDTMAYTASALSFMLEDLGKTVILTGSQIPLGELRNDAIDNLLGALTIAGHFVIPEVGLFFGNRLFRGNVKRTSKVDAMDFAAFDSPNLKPLVTVGIDINVSWPDVQKPTTIARFKAHKYLNPSVTALRLFPGITEATVRAFLSEPVKAVVLLTYGSGNAPSNRPELLAALKEASERGVVIVNCTQCRRGLVSDAYETGRQLLELGVVPGSDMTPECALTKLSYLLGKKYSPEECRSLVRSNLRGELSVPAPRKRFTYQFSNQGLISSIVSILRNSPGHQMHRTTTTAGGGATPRSLHSSPYPHISPSSPTHLQAGHHQQQQQQQQQYNPEGSSVEFSLDEQQETVIADNSNLKISSMLTNNTAVSSNGGRTALLNAATTITTSSISYTTESYSPGLPCATHSTLSDFFTNALHNSNTHILTTSPSSATTSLADLMPGLEHSLVPMMLCYAARVGDLDGLVQVLNEFGNTMVNLADYDGRTPLHIACSEGHLNVVEYLLLQGAMLHLRDRYNHCPLWDATSSRSLAVVKLLRKAGAHFSEEQADEVTAALVRAAATGDVDMIKLLDACGVDFNRTTQDQRTPLHVAVSENRAVVVEYIVDKATALHAKEGQYSGSGGVSLSRSNSNISMSGSSGGFGSLLHLSQVILNQRDRWGKTPLQEAKLLQLDDLVEVLEKGMAVLGITN